MTETDVEQELNRLLNEARLATEPATSARARIRAGLAPRLGGSLPAPAAGFSAGKVSLVLVGGAALVLGAWWLLRPPTAVSSSSGVKDPSAAAVSSSAAAVSSFAPALLPSVPAVWPSARVGTTSSALKPEIVAPALAPSALAPAEVHAPPAAPATPRVGHEEPETELSLISAMQLALRSGNASQALGLAARHAQRFPQGALSQEREGVRAIARCQLAKPEARAPIGADFLAKYGSSPYAARVKDACKP